MNTTEIFSAKPRSISEALCLYLLCCEGYSIRKAIRKEPIQINSNEVITAFEIPKHIKLWWYLMFFQGRYYVATQKRWVNEVFTDERPPDLTQMSENQIREFFRNKLFKSISPRSSVWISMGWVFCAWLHIQVLIFLKSAYGIAFTKNFALSSFDVLSLLYLVLYWFWIKKIILSPSTEYYIVMTARFAFAIMFIGLAFISVDARFLH